MSFPLLLLCWLLLHRLQLHLVLLLLGWLCLLPLRTLKPHLLLHLLLYDFHLSLLRLQLSLQLVYMGCDDRPDGRR